MISEGEIVFVWVNLLMTLWRIRSIHMFQLHYSRNVDMGTSDISMPVYRDCIYTHKAEHMSREVLIPYCRRFEPAEIFFQRRIDCGDHTSFTFSRLKAAQVTVAMLYKWNAPLDIQNDYAEYFAHGIGENELVYCNCTGSWFGTHCEYEKPSRDESLLSLVEAQFNAMRSVRASNVVCYTGLACLNNDHDCLDWRHVCNGIQDCAAGEDEKHCVEMEMHQCDTQTQFRCKNGMCIDRSFFVDFTFDCMDESDEYASNNLVENRCNIGISLSCEERMCGWLKTSCGNGFCQSNPLILCQDRWPPLYYEKYFPKHLTFEEENCSRLMVCATKVKSLLTMANLSVGLCTDRFGEPSVYNSVMRKICPGLVAFPAMPMFHPAIRLVFNTSILKSELIPDYVCFESVDACPNYAPSRSLIVSNHTLYCRHISNYENVRLDTDYASFLEKIQKLHSYCISNCPADSTQLFHCKNTHQCLSPNRLFDGYDDCIGTGTNDEEVLTVCQPSVTDRILCNAGLHNSTQCVPRIRIFESQFQSLCTARTPEIGPLHCQTPSEYGCRFIRGEEPQRHLFRFQETCNGLIHQSWSEANTTDEDSCEERQRECHSRYQKCNRIWDCFDGADELHCPEYLRMNDGCDLSYHYCYELKNPSRVGCLPRARTSDGIIDCLGASDERMTHCPRLYPNEPHRRFKCLNHSLCVPVYDVCDGRRDCPLGDDEWPCPDRSYSNCPNDTFLLSDRRTCIADISRCSESYMKLSSTNRIFCDLIGRRKFVITTLDGYKPYPPRANQVLNVNQEQLIRSTAVEYHPLSLFKNCRNGFALASGQCLCPPSYYGNECQWQSDRLTVILRLDVQPDIYDLETAIFTLVLRIDQTHHHEQIMHFHQQQEAVRHTIYLLTPTDKRRISVRIDACLTTSDIVHQRMAWIFDVPFPFLPVNRLALRLSIGDSQPPISCSIVCVHGTCVPYATDPQRQYCRCEQSWHGVDCNTPSQISCKKGAEEIQGVCVCTLQYHGRGCYIKKFNFCHRHLCQNNGTCIPFDIRIAPFYVCRCSNKYYGSRCQYQAATILLHIPLKSNFQELDHIPLIMVHFLDVDSQIGVMSIQDRIIFRNIQHGSKLSVVYESHSHLSDFIFVQRFSSANTLRGAFHLVSLTQYKRSAITTEVLDSNYCPAIEEILNFDILKQPYVRRVQYYHRPCLKLGTSCFHDEQYLCLCDDIARFDCYAFDHQAGNCSDRQLCQNGAHCFYARQKRPSIDFGCVCTECYYGSLCQFTTSQYAISLEALLDHTNELTIYLALIIFGVGFVSNSCSIIVFIKRKTREIGCGNYLLFLSTFAQITLLTFATKFLIVLHGNNSLINCIGVEYLLSVVPSIFDWLTACIATERMFIVTCGVNFDKKLSTKISKMIITIIILVNLGASLHEPFRRQIISDPRSSSHTWCVEKFSSAFLEMYQVVLNIVHLIGPFTANFLTTMVLTYKLSKQKSASLIGADSEKDWNAILKQIRKHSSFIISPLLLLMATMPRLIFVFAFACVTESWKRNTYLMSYVVACLPYMAVSFIYVYPSQHYTGELKSSFRIIFTCVWSSATKVHT